MAAVEPAPIGMSDNAGMKVAQAVIRFVAFGLFLTSFLLYAGDLLLYLSRRPVSGAGALALKGVPLLLGVILYCASRPIAVRLTKDLD